MDAEWLFKKDEYIPVKDKEKFINKTILTIINVLGVIRRKESYSNKSYYRTNSTVKVIFTFLNIILLSLSRNIVFVLAIDLYLIISTLFIEKEDRIKIFIISLMVPVFTLIMLIPSFIMGNKLNSILILFKVIGTIIFINILSYTTKWTQITRALKLLFIPDLFIWIMEITIKYIVILGDYSLNLLYALKLRSIGKNNSKYSSLSSIAGTLFLKSKDMGEEMFSAMECRGFTGEYKGFINTKVTKFDTLYIIINIFILVVFLLS